MTSVQVGRLFMVVMGLFLVLGLLLWALGITGGEQARESEYNIPGDEYINLTEEELRDHLTEVGYSTFAVEQAVANFEDNKDKMRWWREREEHWDNVDSFYLTVKAASADNVVSEAEAQDLCFKSAQWREQLQASRSYVQAYRELDPETVDNPGNDLLTLEQLTNDGLEGLLVIQASCPQ